jgi:hypothetical protein
MMSMERRAFIAGLLALPAVRTIAQTPAKPVVEVYKSPT